MVKVIVQITRIAVAVMLLFLSFSCGFDFKTTDGTGNVTTEKRDINSTITTVVAGRGLEVIVEQGNQPSLTVEADQNLHKHIITELKGDKLEITADTNIGNADAKRIIVVLPNIKRLESAGGSSLTAKGTIKGSRLEASSSSGSSLEAAIEAGSIKCEASSGSSLKLTGNAEYLEANANSGSTLEAGDLKAIKAKAETSSGANATVNVTQALYADATSGSNISYKGTPAKLDSHDSSGGSVSKQ